MHVAHLMLYVKKFKHLTKIIDVGFSFMIGYGQFSSSQKSSTYPHFPPFLAGISKNLNEKYSFIELYRWHLYIYLLFNLDKAFNKLIITVEIGF